MSGQPKGNRKHILVVDDEPKILDALASFLVSRGFIVSQARTGREALAAFARNSISLIVLDLMLPDMSGEDVCTVIRRHSRVPIIMLTAKSDEASHVSGIGLGADDYLVKPFRLGVLIAHIEAILRRSETDLVPLMAKSSWRNGDLVVDFAQGTVLKGGMLISLTKKERNILATLIKYPGKVFTREELLRIAFGYDFFGNDRVIDTHIKNLRKKLEDDPKSPVYIRTIHGLGYQFGGS
ncbi:MAG: response regulator transcription factor [Coriobacteriaceae bacterium]|nr:response regulator transcription factor [Coriobacteriaceae bacterium]